MSFIPNKELKIKEKQDKMLKEQLEKEREHQLLAEIDKTEKERIKKKGNTSSFILQSGTNLWYRFETFENQRHSGSLLV